MNFRYSLVFFFASYLVAACDDEKQDDLLLPSDLVVTITTTNGSGTIAVEASAANANFYTIYFGEQPNEAPVKSNDGKASHTYSAAGAYTLRIQANATASQYIEEEKEVEISLSTNSGLNIPTTGYVSPTSYEGLTLQWEDDFTGTTLNTANWTAEIGRGSNGWGNNELQYYRAENTIVQDGYLIITAKKENFSGAEYTSSRLITRGKKFFKYGRVDIRAALPKGQGIWPALWMLGENFPTVGWPKCGEIDIMEMVGGGAGRDNTVYGTLHWDNAGTNACTCGHHGYTLSSGIFADEFHVFSIVWNANTITWYVDNVQYHVIDISPAELSEFDESFFFIFNVAVGGNWPGSPNAATTFPQNLIVDYIRVFQ